MAAPMPISIEVVRAGPVAAAMIERLRASYRVQGPDQLGVLEVLISAEDWEQARQRITAVIAGVDRAWEEHLRFAR